MFDKNIALALYNRGQYDESVEYFEKALDVFWGKLPKHPVHQFFKFTAGFIHFLIALFFPSFKFRKEPSAEDINAIELYYKKCKALIMIDPKKFFIESFYFMRKVAIYKYERFRDGIGFFVGASALFSFTGLSFRLSAKILKFADNRIDKSNDRQVITYDLLNTTHQALKGNWQKIRPYDDRLVNRIIEMGEIWLASQYIHWHANPTICRGDIQAAEDMSAKLLEMGTVYENDLARLFYFILITSLLMECGRFKQAAQKIDEAIDFIKKSGPHVALIDMYSIKARLHYELNNSSETKKFIKLADAIMPGANAVPSQMGEYYLVCCEYYIHQLSLSQTDEDDLHAKALKAAKKFLKNARYAAYNIPKAQILMGNLYWLRSRQRKALSWWSKALSESEKMEAHLSLAKCYLNVGRHLMREESKFKKLNGIAGKDYIEKAEQLYDRIGLQWDPDEKNIVR